MCLAWELGNRATSLPWGVSPVTNSSLPGRVSSCACPPLQFCICSVLSLRGHTLQLFRSHCLGLPGSQQWVCWVAISPHTVARGAFWLALGRCLPPVDNKVSCWGMRGRQVRRRAKSMRLGICLFSKPWISSAWTSLRCPSTDIRGIDMLGRVPLGCCASPKLSTRNDRNKWGASSRGRQGGAVENTSALRAG